MQKFRLSPHLYLFGIVYFVITTLVHFRAPLFIPISLYLLGAVVGLHLLGLVEVVLGISPAPFHTVLAQVVIFFVTLFILTSSRNDVGRGIVLFLNLTLLYLQWVDFSKDTLALWFGGAVHTVTKAQQKSYILILVGVFVWETLLFVTI